MMPKQYFSQGGDAESFSRMPAVRETRSTLNPVSRAYEIEDAQDGLGALFLDYMNTKKISQLPGNRETYSQGVRNLMESVTPDTRNYLQGVNEAAMLDYLNEQQFFAEDVLPTDPAARDAAIYRGKVPYGLEDRSFLYRQGMYGIKGLAKTDSRMPEELKESFIAGKNVFENTPIHEGYHQAIPNFGESTQRAIDLYRGKLLGDQDLIDESNRFLKGKGFNIDEEKRDLGEVRIKALRGLMNIQDKFYKDLPESSKNYFREALEKRMTPTFLSSIFGGDEREFDSEGFVLSEIAALPEPDFLDMLKDVAAFQSDRGSYDYLRIDEPRTVGDGDAAVRGYRDGGGVQSLAPQARMMFRR